MPSEIFVDTSGFYALLIKRDDRHRAASTLLHSARDSKQRFVTTDYVLDETLTLLKVRGHAHLISALCDAVFGSQACRMEWTGSQRFHDALTLFLRRLDHGWSFTDCLSFRVMKELRLRDALTKDAHYAEAGFSALLA